MSMQEAITEFRSQFRGAVFAPEDAAYEETRKVYNGMIDRRPRLIAKCANTADVMAAFGVPMENEDHHSFHVSPGRYRGREYAIEPDVSAATYFLGAAKTPDMLLQMPVAGE